nr:PREDICTED: ribonuclease inhibitor-like [Anolis carolinensis]|eukprot:XP_008118800.1 PREDICTED: ribonuclease inhibitor-like [Anolis carolinensis]
MRVVAQPSQPIFHQEMDLETDYASGPEDIPGQERGPLALQLPDVIMPEDPLIREHSDAWLHQCSLTGAACTDLASVLETGPTLMELNLGDNSLGDDGVRQLCLALKKPDCKLRKLALTMGSLNRTTKTRLQAAISARPEMTVVSYYSPSFLAFPGDEGSWGMFPRS